MIFLAKKHTQNTTASATRKRKIIETYPCHGSVKLETVAPIRASINNVAKPIHREMRTAIVPVRTCKNIFIVFS